jgi:hypothetical protein
MTEATGPVTGDYCSFGRLPSSPWHITHYRCDDFADGTVTDAKADRPVILVEAPAGALRGFNR